MEQQRGIERPGARSKMTDLGWLLKPSHSVLVIWDMQNGVAGRVPDREQLCDRVRSLVQAADSSGVPVFWTRHVNPRLNMTTMAGLRLLMVRQKVTDPGSLQATMQEGSEDVELLPEMAPKPHHVVMTKRTPSLFIGTDADLMFRGLATTTVVLAGVATEMGIEFSARHASALGYIPVVPHDAVGSFSDTNHQLGMELIRSFSVVPSTEEVVIAWS